MQKKIKQWLRSRLNFSLYMYCISAGFQKSRLLGTNSTGVSRIQDTLRVGEIFLRFEVILIGQFSSHLISIKKLELKLIRHFRLEIYAAQYDAEICASSWPRSWLTAQSMKQYTMSHSLLVRENFMCFEVIWIVHRNHSYSTPKSW